MTILEKTKLEKEQLLLRMEKQLLGDGSPFSLSTKKKIVTYENLLRFYQNSIVTFALEDHQHYTPDIITDKEHRFVTDAQIEAINKYSSTTTVSEDEILALFK